MGESGRGESNLGDGGTIPPTAARFQATAAREIDSRQLWRRSIQSCQVKRNRQREWAGGVGLGLVHRLRPGAPPVSPACRRRPRRVSEFFSFFINRENRTRQR